VAITLEMIRNGATLLVNFFGVGFIGCIDVAQKNW
jgi:hypothetical protein